MQNILWTVYNLMTPSVTLDVILQRLSHVQQSEQRENAKASRADHFYRSFSSVQAISHNAVILHWYQQNTAQNQADIKLMAALLTSKILPRSCVCKCLFKYIAKSENAEDSYLNIT